MEYWGVAVLNMGLAGVQAVRAWPTRKPLLENLSAYICANLRLICGSVRVHSRSLFVSIRGQPLTEPAAMPWMKRRCMRRKKPTAGATIRMAAAMISPQSLVYCPPRV
jgi:hypothetical protein